MTKQAVVIGAGMGGLAAALALNAQGWRVRVLESQLHPGGKMRQVKVSGALIDAGPTVLTMRPVLEKLFALAGTRIEAELDLQPLSVLARHAWPDGSRLDLFANAHESEAAIADFAGGDEAARWRTFHQRASAIHDTLRSSFMEASRPGPLQLARRVGLFSPGKLLGISPFQTLWQALEQHFRDPRLRQLYGRYATYVGSSPFESPATLMLIAHVEQLGVWTVKGGMHAVAAALTRLAQARGVEFEFGVAAEDIAAKPLSVGRANGAALACDAIVSNADVSAFSIGALGQSARTATLPVERSRRSLSAVTVNTVGLTSGFPLSHHTVFFSADYAAEFNSLFKDRRMPSDPTLYVCAQDRVDETAQPQGRERLLLLINAPADGDLPAGRSQGDEAPVARIFAKLESMGLTLDDNPAARVVTTPEEFNRRFPGSGGALYGEAGHGWMAAFRRSGARSRLPGIYLAGGSVHPGAGVPMALLSGMEAARAVVEDLGHG